MFFCSDRFYYKTDEWHKANYVVVRRSGEVSYGSSSYMFFQGMRLIHDE